MKSRITIRQPASGRPTCLDAWLSSGGISAFALLAAVMLGGPALAAPEVIASGALAGEAAFTGEPRPRTIVTTDGEADDMNSLMRLLYYTNEIDVAGLVYSSSVHHWKGDGVHTLSEARTAGIVTSFHGETAGTPLRSDDAITWRWNPDSWIEDQISRYASILPDLRRHDPAYPSARELLSGVAVGNVDFENGFSTDTPGSNLIKAALLDDDGRNLWLQAWGGQNTIARALKSIEDQFRGTSQWSRIRSKIVSKAVIATIGNQDDAYADYIGKAWPEIRVYDWGFTSTSWTGGGQFATIPAAIKTYYKNQFWTENIKLGHGPLLSGYHLIGDGQYLKGESGALGWQPGRAGIDYDLATWRLYDFLGPFERYDMLSEGDTPAFLSLIETGLRFLEDPSLGGWGGRFASTVATPNLFSPQGDLNPMTGSAEPAYSLFRWVGDAQRDFAARADWGVTASYETANHAPVVDLKTPRVTARAGSEVVLLGTVSDPDGDRVTTSWSVHEDASSVVADPTIGVAGVGKLQALPVTVPVDAEPGQRIVVLLTATDDGTPALTRYGEAVIIVR